MVVIVLQYILVHAKSLQSCLTLCNSMNYIPIGSSVYGILKARILEWVVMLSSRGSSQPRDWTHISPIAGRFFIAKPLGKPKNTQVGSLSFVQGIFQTQKLNQVSCNASILFTSWATRQNIIEVFCCSAAQWYPTCCDCMDCSKPGFLILHHLLHLAQTHVHGVSDAMQPINPLSCHSHLAFSLSQHQGLF